MTNSENSRTWRWAVIGEVHGVEHYPTKAEANDRIQALKSKGIKALLYDEATPLPRGIGMGRID